MSKQSFSAFYRMLSGFIAVCLLSADIAGAAALIDLQGPEPIGAPIAVVVPPAEEQTLFRTTVTLRQPRDLSRVRDMGAVVLEADETSAVLLVTADQLADLARLRFQPTASDELGALVQAAGPSYEWLRAELRPTLEQAAEVSGQWSVISNQTTDDGRQTTAAAAELVGLLATITAGQRAAIAALAATDSDNDGLTDTQEGWWCTNATRADTDSDGANDGAEVAAAKNWLANAAASYPSTGKPFQGWPPQIAGCYDDDLDSVPDLAEVLDLGLNNNLESTDRDKFDDGQELFGNTYCTGQGGFCSYGQLPRNADWGTIFSQMPSWVERPGNHPFVAAFPIPEIDVVDNSLKVESVTTIEAGHTISSGTQRSYSTTRTEGTSDSVANSTTWNEWEESSEAYEEPANSPQVTVSAVEATDVENCGIWDKLQGQCRTIHDKTLRGQDATSCWSTNTNLGWNLGGSLGWDLGPKAELNGGVEGGTSHDQMGPLEIGCQAYIGRRLAAMPPDQLEELKRNVAVYREVVDGQRIDPPATTGSGQTIVNNSIDTNALVGGLEGIQLATTQAGQMVATQLVQVAAAIRQPRLTTTESSGKSHGGSQTIEHTTYEEHSVTNGEAFTTEEGWSNATAVNSAHAADLWFSYKVSNNGAEYAREICNLAFNLYIGDEANPAATYFVANDLGGSGCFANFMPNAERTFTSARIPLSLAQMKAIDTGQPFRIEVEDFAYGIDQLFYEDALNAGIVFALEDGQDDGDETIDSYVLPTWGDETVLDVMARYFPHTTNAYGDLQAIWTPEYRSDTPAWCTEPRALGTGGNRTLWCKHILSNADWWNVFTDGLGTGSEGFQDTPASAGGMALFRFNQDTDRDGFSDRSERRLGTDPNDPTKYPYPELVGGVHSIRTGNTVNATLSLLNAGTYDAYAVGAVLVAPDDSITITDNTVGGAGRVRNQRSVIVGSRIAPPAYTTTTWSGTALPQSGGYFTGGAPRTYTFSVACATPGGCAVGSGTWTINWSDGTGGDLDGALSFGAGYATPTFVDVGTLGVQVALVSGTVNNGDRFTVEARPPLDTFTYTINREPYTPPLVIVRYNDQRGNHRFVVPPEGMSLSSPAADLSGLRGKMIGDGGVAISTSTPFTPGANSFSLVANNPSPYQLAGAHFYVEFIDLQGQVVHQIPLTVDLPPGPTIVPVNWNSNAFNPSLHEGQDYIVMAFWTDYQNNILDTAARPLSSFQEDGVAALEVEPESLTWNFGTVAKGTILKKSITIANTGRTELYMRPTPAGGLTMSPATLRVEPGGFATAELVLDTLALPVGAYATPVALRTSDPARPTVQVNASGTVNATANGVVAYSDDPYRPWDRVIRFTNAQAAGVATTFAHAITTDGNRATPLFYQDAAGNRLGDGRDIAEWAGTTTELVQNGGFESGGGHFWTTGSGVWSIATGQAHAGVYSAQPVQQNNQNPYLYQDLDLSNWRTWIDQGYGRATWHNWVKSGAQAGSVNIAYYRADGSQITSGSSGWLSTGNTWQQHNSTQSIPVGATRARITLTAQPATGDTGWIELINNSNNGGFETGNMLYWYTDGTTYDTRTSKPHSGAYHVHGTTAGNYHYFYRDAGVNSSYHSLLDAGYGSVSFSAWIKPGTDETIRVELRYQLSNGTWVTGFDTGNVGPFSSAQPYSQVTYQGAIPGGVRNIRPVFTTKRLSSGTYTEANVDDVALSIRFSGNPVASETYFDDISFKLAPQYAAETKPDDNTATVLTSPDAIAAGASRRMQYGLKQQYAAAGDQTFTVRLPDHPYSSVTFDALLRDPAGNPAGTTIAMDVGANGSVDWQAPGLPVFPTALTTGNLAAAVSAYMADQPTGADGMVDVPLKISLGNGGTLFLTNLQATRGTDTDGAITNADVSLTQANPTEGDTTTVNATVRSSGATIDGVTVGFFASLPNGLDWYLGSRYLPSVSPSGTQTSLVWDTTGFTGATTVKVIIDPYNALAETNEGNNQGSKSATVKTRPNLRPTAVTPATLFPIAGETITVDVAVQNNGQTPSAAADCALYLGNPDAGGTLIGSQACGPLGANTSVTLTYQWTPGAVGPARLFARADSGHALDEPDEFDNDRWLDLDVADPGPMPPYQPGNPNPADNAPNVPVTTNLSWTGGDPNPGNTVNYKVYLDTVNPPATLKITQSATTYDPPGDLLQCTTYYWQIVATDNTSRTTNGLVWRFSTYCPTNTAPTKPVNTSPANSATGVTKTPQLCWSASTDPDGDPVTYDVYRGTVNPPATVVSPNQSATCYTSPALAGHTTYYWKVVAKDNRDGSTPGDVWSFTTANTAPTAPSNPNPADGATNVPVNTQVCWTASSDGDNDALTYEVRFGTSNPSGTVVASQSATCYDPPGDLPAGALHYWQIVARDAFGGATAGPVWTFTTAGDGPTAPGIYFISPTGAATIGGFAATGADILRYTPAGNSWAMVYDGSYIKTPKNVGAFAFLGSDILLGFTAAQVVPGLGTTAAAPQDLVRFTPSRTGYNNTAGAFAWFFDGSDVGLTTSGEIIDALWIDAAGRLYISTAGSGAVPVNSANPTGPTVKFQDEDVLRFTPSAGSGGQNTAGTWETYWNPTAITGMSAEDINGYWEDSATGYRYVTVLGAFTIGNAAYGGKFTGNGKTVLRFAPNAAAPEGWAPVEKVTWLAPGATFPSNLDGIEMGR